MNEEIRVLGTRVHNLQNIDVTIPRNKLVVITGLSGSGKSSWPSIQYMLRVRGDTWRLFQFMPVSSLVE